MKKKKTTTTNSSNNSNGNNILIKNGRLFSWAMIYLRAIYQVMSLRGKIERRVTKHTNVINLGSFARTRTARILMRHSTPEESENGGFHSEKAANVFHSNYARGIKKGNYHRPFWICVLRNRKALFSKCNLSRLKRKATFSNVTGQQA